MRKLELKDARILMSRLREWYEILVPYAPELIMEGFAMIPEIDYKRLESWTIGENEPVLSRRRVLYEIFGQEEYLTVEGGNLCWMGKRYPIKQRISGNLAQRSVFLPSIENIEYYLEEDNLGATCLCAKLKEESC